MSEACRANQCHSAETPRDDRACEVSREGSRLIGADAVTSLTSIFAVPCEIHIRGIATEGPLPWPIKPAVLPVPPVHRVALDRRLVIRFCTAATSRTPSASIFLFSGVNSAKLTTSPGVRPPMICSIW